MSQNTADLPSKPTLLIIQLFSTKETLCHLTYLNVGFFFPLNNLDYIIWATFKKRVSLFTHCEIIQCFAASTLYALYCFHHG